MPAFNHWVLLLPPGNAFALHVRLRGQSTPRCLLCVRKTKGYWHSLKNTCVD